MLALSSHTFTATMIRPCFRHSQFPAAAAALMAACAVMFAAGVLPVSVNVKLAVWAFATVMFVAALLRLRSAFMDWVDACLQQRNQRLREQLAGGAGETEQENEGA